MKKLFIWDFQWTLEKCNELAVREYINMSLEQEGYEKRLSDEECKMLYGKKIWEFFQYLCPNESAERCMELQGSFLKAELDHPEILMNCIKPNDGAIDVLEAIQNSSHDQFLVSNTEIHMLMPFIKSIGIERFFPEGYRFATNAHSGDQTTKHDVLKRFLDGKTFDQLVATGDSPHDLSFLEEHGGTTYLYAHPGWNFREYDATYKIRDLREVLREL